MPKFSSMVVSPAPSPYLQVHQLNKTEKLKIDAEVVIVAAVVI